ncbi:MAG: RNA-binding domain-containing protein [Lentimicrobium sp.]
MSFKNLIDRTVKTGASENLETFNVFRKEALGKVVCSFLNGEGGQIVIGISKENKVIGIVKATKVFSDIEQYLSESILPEFPLSLSIEKYRDKDLILLNLYKGSKQPYIFNGSIYFRRNKITRKANNQELLALINSRKESEIHWGRKTRVDFQYDDLDSEELISTINSVRNKKIIHDYSNDPIDFLVSYGLYQGSNFTNSAIILFAKNPTRFIPQARVKLIVIDKRGNSKDIINSYIYDSNIFKNIDNILATILNYITTYQISSNQQLRKIDYIIPQEALREGIINALVHRDYSLSSGSLLITISSDRLEIVNSGKSPVSLEQLHSQHLSIPVNPDIAHIVFIRGFIEGIGSGTLRIIESCKNMHSAKPIWKMDEMSVSLIFLGNFKTHE